MAPTSSKLDSKSDIKSIAVKPTGADIPKKEKRKLDNTIKYISRNTVIFDDDKSDCRDDPPEDDENNDDAMAKTGEAYLQK